MPIPKIKWAFPQTENNNNNNNNNNKELIPTLAVYIYIFLKICYVLGAWVRFFRARLIKKDIFFAYTPPKKMRFLTIFNENIFFQNSGD